MARDAYAAMFLYRLGQDVRWAESPQERYRISQRRWTERDIMPPVAEYFLRQILPDGTGGDIVGEWAYEADVEVGED